MSQVVQIFLCTFASSLFWLSFSLACLLQTFFSNFPVFSLRTMAQWTFPFSWNVCMVLGCSSYMAILFLPQMSPNLMGWHYRKISGMQTWTFTRNSWDDGKNWKTAQDTSKRVIDPCATVALIISPVGYLQNTTRSDFVLFFFFFYRRLEAVFEVNTDLQKNVQAKVTAHLIWPSLVNSSQRITFPLTNTNSSSVSRNHPSLVSACTHTRAGNLEGVVKDLC